MRRRWILRVYVIYRIGNDLPVPDMNRSTASQHARPIRNYIGVGGARSCSSHTLIVAKWAGTGIADSGRDLELAIRSPGRSVRV